MIKLCTFQFNCGLPNISSAMADDASFEYFFKAMPTVESFNTVPVFLFKLLSTLAKRSTNVTTYSQGVN